HNAVCWEVHTALLPNAWGDRGQMAARLLPEWIWQHTDCRRIITNVPRNNRLALRFALQAGVEQYGVEVKSYPKHRGRHDQILLGISAPDKPPRHRTETALDSIAGVKEVECH